LVPEARHLPLPPVLNTASALPSAFFTRNAAAGLRGRRFGLVGDLGGVEAEARDGIVAGGGRLEVLAGSAGARGDRHDLLVHDLSLRFRVEHRVAAEAGVARALQDAGVVARILRRAAHTTPSTAVAGLARLVAGALLAVLTDAGEVGALVHVRGGDTMDAVARVDLHRGDVPAGRRLDKLGLALRVAVE
jgi:hypothetical protein